MELIDLTEIKKIQLEILDAVHEFCILNNIQYSLACGTLLGAARHRGYIPWDDDIDIYMLREDYDYFLSCFPQIYKNRYELISLERNKTWNRAYAKVTDNRTILREKAFTTTCIGINIDVFPLDYVPENRAKWFIYNKIRRFINHIYNLKVTKYNPNRNIFKNLILEVSKFVLYPISSRKIAFLLKWYCTRIKKTNYLFESVLGMLLRNPFNIKIFSNFDLISFEDRKYYATANFEEYLSAAYGEWQKLPPEEKRVSHHSFEAFWK